MTMAFKYFATALSISGSYFNVSYGGVFIVVDDWTILTEGLFVMVA